MIGKRQGKRRTVWIVSAAIWFFSTTLVAHAQRDAQVPDPDPELERRSFQTAEGFEVDLFAADPRIAKPIQMNFDAKGRLWVVSSEVYPQIQPGQIADDKVLILEDNDGDGKADKTTVFADGLLIPTGIEPGDGGAYVGASTELLFLKDTDGDGKADSRRVVLSGFGTEDTHHILHTLRWGEDGCLYFNQSIYIHSHIETPRGVRRLAGSGIWRFRPESMELDVFMKGLVNPWGHHVDRYGQTFATDGAGGEGINYVFPGAAFASAVDAPRITAGLNPGSPKHCGLEVLSGRHLPEEWQGNLLTNDFRGHRVCRFVLSDDGSGFASRERTELIKTTHPAFRPIDIKMGPDGAIYIADWYNPIIQHGEVDFRDPRRDHTRGRIWRVTAKGRPLVERPKLAESGIDDLLESLKAPEGWTRHFAKRVLKERGASAVLPKLALFLKQLDPLDPEKEHHRLEALWTYQSLDVVKPKLLEELTRSSDPRVRAAAVRVAGLWRDRLAEAGDLLAPRATDENPRVRLEAVRALARVREPRSIVQAFRAFSLPTDRFLNDALWWTARDLKDVWLPEVQAGRLDFEGNPHALIFALEAVGSPSVVGPLVEALRSGRLNDEQQGRVAISLARLGGPAELRRIFDLAIERESGRLLSALAMAAERRQVRPEGDLGGIAALLDSNDDAVRAPAARLVGFWKLDGLRSKLAAIAQDAKTSAASRAGAVEGLARLPHTAAVLKELTRQGGPCRLNAAIALAAIDLKQAADAAVDLLAEPETDATALTQAFLERRSGAETLANELVGKKIARDSAKKALRTVRARGASAQSQSLIDALMKAGDLSAATKPMSAEERERLLREVAAVGKPDRGEAIFRRGDLGCLNCHAIAGAGGRLGPDLASIGASAQPDYLIISLEQPGAAVKEGYDAVVVALNDGKTLTGIKTGQTDTDLILRDAEDREIAVPLASIDEQKPGGSMMPGGLTDSLTHDELIDLVAFLSRLGKIGSYAVGQEAVARSWRKVEPSAEALAAVRSHSLESILRSNSDGNLKWSPIYARVSGDLPSEEIPTIEGVRIARTSFEVTTPGRLRLVLRVPPKTRLWINGQGTDPQTRIDRNFKSGTYTLSFIFPAEASAPNPRVELQEIEGSKAKARVLLGK